MLSGTVRIFDGARWISARAGDYCSVPEGGRHGFRNESGEPASMLILLPGSAPAAPDDGWRRRLDIDPATTMLFRLTRNTPWS